LVETVKVALVAPAGTVTLASTVATPVLLLVNVTTVPLDEAGALNVTVPWELFPPLTEVGLSVNEATVTVEAGFTVRVADWVTPPAEAVMLTRV
jgi:hypothetical protein